MKPDPASPADTERTELVARLEHIAEHAEFLETLKDRYPLSALTIGVLDDCAALLRALASKTEGRPSYTPASGTRAELAARLRAGLTWHGDLNWAADLIEPARSAEQPVAWARGVHQPSSPHGPAEYDLDVQAGEDQPDGEGWFPLYRALAAPPTGEAVAWLYPRRWGSGVTLSQSEAEVIAKSLKDEEGGTVEPLYRALAAPVTLPKNIALLISAARDHANISDGINQPSIAALLRRLADALEGKKGGHSG